METVHNDLQLTKPIPNSSAVLVLGILSIVAFCCTAGLVSLALSITAIVLSSTAMHLYRSNPSAYTQASLSNLKAGKICAIIGLTLSGLIVLTILAGIIFFSAALDALMEFIPWQKILESL